MLIGTADAGTLQSGLQDFLEALDGVAYVTDANGVIIACSQSGWDRALNDSASAVKVAANDVIGRSLFEFIDGEEVRETYRVRMARLAAAPDTPRRLTFRCDTPTLERSLRLSISALRHGGQLVGFLFQSVSVTLRDRPAMELFSFERHRAVAGDAEEEVFLGMCSYCQKVRFPAGSVEGEGEWVEPAEYYRRGGVEGVVVSHGVCRPCFDTVVHDELVSAVSGTV